MGVAITPLVKKSEVTIESLRGKILVVDAFNILYQFLTTIRARDGTPLTDSKGQVTSHLIGLFSRTTNLMTSGLKLVFIFDGEAPKLKTAERERRRALKADAQQKFDAAKAAQDVDAMRKFSQRTVKLTDEMLVEAKKLLEALGVPWIQAPSEGEAQAAYMVNKGDAYAVVSQDADALLFGGSRVIRYLGISGKKKKTNTLSYERQLPQMITLQATLDELNIDQDHLIALSMLVGTDFNPGGVKGLGPKKALKLVQEVSDLEEIFTQAAWDEHCEYPWKEVFDVFKNIPTIDDYSLEWKAPNAQELKRLLVDEHDFSKERVETTLEKLEKNTAQKGLGEFF